MPKKPPEEKPEEKQEKPTKEQLKKVKKKSTPEKKEKWKFPIEEEEEKDSSESPGGIGKPEETEAIGLEEVCGNILFVAYQVWGIAQKGIEPLTEDTKNLASPPMARLARKYHLEDKMNDEIMLAGILGVDITKRIIVLNKKKKKEEKKTDPATPGIED